MTVKEFVNKCKINKDIEKYIEDRIKIKYLPYSTKIAIGERILNATCYTNTEPNLFKINTPMRKMLFMLSMINEYTDIDIDWNNSLSEFDALSENAYIGIILSKIEETELNLCSSILEMMLDDLLSNERDLVSYIDTKVESMKLGFDSLLETINSEEIQKLIVDKLS